MNTNEVEPSKGQEIGTPTLRVEKKIENSTPQKAETAQEQHKKKMIEQQELLRKRNEYKKILRENVEMLELQYKELELSLKIHDLQQVRTKLLEVEDQRLKSNDIAERSHLTRATVIHHLNNLMERGLVISKNNKYLLRENNFEELLEDIEKDFTRIFKDLKRKARELDKELETF